MKKTLLVLPAILLLIAPAATFAENNIQENHGSQVSVVARDNDKDGNHGTQVSIVAKDNHEAQVNENKENAQVKEGLENENHGAEATAEANENSQIKTKINLKNKDDHNSTATNEATPSAHINVSGPLDQVIKALENILNFLKGLV